MRASFLVLVFSFAASLAGCASAPPPTPITPDPVTPPGHWEMNVADEETAPTPPPADAHQTDKPNVASKSAKRSLFNLPKKSQ